MRRYQFGVSLSGLIMAAVILIAAAMLGLKLAPSYIEFFSIKKAVVALASEKKGASVTDIKKGFDQRAVVDNITTVKGADLEVTKEGNEVVISVGFRKEVPLFGNVGMYVDFSASSKE